MVRIRCAVAVAACFPQWKAVQIFPITKDMKYIHAYFVQFQKEVMIVLVTQNLLPFNTNTVTVVL